MIPKNLIVHEAKANTLCEIEPRSSYPRLTGPGQEAFWSPTAEQFGFIQPGLHEQCQAYAV
jgi:hypothetical protein